MPDDDGVGDVLHGVRERVLDVLERVVLLLGRSAQALEQSVHRLGRNVGDRADGRLGLGVDVEHVMLQGDAGEYLEIEEEEVRGGVWGKFRLQSRLVNRLAVVQNGETKIKTVCFVGFLHNT